MIEEQIEPNRIERAYVQFRDSLKIPKVLDWDDAFIHISDGHARSLKGRRDNYVNKLAAAAAVLMACFFLRAQDSVLLYWNASPSTNVVGYEILYGTNTGFYTFRTNAQASTSILISGLTPRVEYFFVAYAYDANGNTGPFSNEADFNAPWLGQPSLNNGSKMVSIYSGTNLSAPGNLLYQFQETNALAPQRYYWLKIQ